MAVVNDMARMWRRPRAVFADLLAMGEREDRAIAWLMAGCFLVFVAQWPRLARISLLEGTDLSQRMAYEFFAWMMIWPLAFYLLAALGLLVARAFGARVGGFGGRLALFWAHLSAAPVALFQGLLVGLNGSGPASDIVGALWLGALAVFWITGLAEAGRRHADA
jgi:hypothetical protein